VVGHLELRDEVWRDSFHDKAEVKLYVSYVRRRFEALGIDPIETVRGVGYRFCAHPTVAKGG
jgi:DNA-binding winged helix-turn-helix (wHTH) protein